MVNPATGFNIERIGGGRYATSTRTSTLNLVRTNPVHLQGTGDAERDVINGVGKGDASFGNMLLSQLDSTSMLEAKSEQLATQFMVDPESVNEHDVTIASTQATLAINMTTTIVNKAVEAYKSIMSLS